MDPRTTTFVKFDVRVVFNFNLKFLEPNGHGHLYVYMCVFLVTITKFMLKKYHSINIIARYKGKKIVIDIKGLNNGTLTYQK